MRYRPHSWRDVSRITRREAGGAHPWLRLQGSLVDALAHHCNTPVQVRVVEEVRRRPRAWELAYGADSARLRALVREVVLEAADRQLVFAHSVLPLAALTGPLRRLRRLGSRPLGSFLFRHPHARRERLEAARIEPGSPLHERASRAAGKTLPPLWARQSVYRVDGPPLRVVEVFLPELLP